MESYGSLWKMREQSIDKLGKQGVGSPESSTRKEIRDYVIEGQSVTLPPC